MRLVLRYSKICRPSTNLHTLSFVFCINLKGFLKCKNTIACNAVALVGLTKLQFPHNLVWLVLPRANQACYPYSQDVEW